MTRLASSIAAFLIVFVGLLAGAVSFVGYRYEISVPLEDEFPAAKDSQIDQIIGGSTSIFRNPGKIFADLLREQLITSTSRIPNIPETQPPSSSLNDSNVNYSADEQFVQSVREQARSAKIIIEMDTDMAINEIYPVRLYIQRGPAADMVALESTTPQMPVLQTDVQIASQAGASVLGTPNLKVDSKSPEWQTVTRDPATMWVWDVTPTTQGEGMLTFQLRHKVDIGGKETILGVRHFPQHVKIIVGPWARLNSYVSAFLDNAGKLGDGWKFGAGIVAAVPAVLLWWRRKPNKA